ncbi:MAG: Transporter [Thermococcales archaeon 44_46]|uniref:sodium-dependent transporter n=1 Tax=Thermococcus sp. PK TaxID=913025 RepID=UPI0005B275F9|nr:sodium-dependent transporter [Thermococcus sp. PK]KUJ99653.1 MAG: Transporter [Thermococcales archaeon 44_46]MDK2783970.1 neurotransmitter:Na+ symporter, family [Thermococcaceae archaeon]MDK2853533.1 neurotransmitter:Na+ symporter, family [Thermococcaceae archaeon]MDK2983171.1 neurotransmitter:Na+ symporter, family [Thermococcaceae archaeon]HIH71861.1 sodium-dependent transporter [Thermococcaceae archaeon]
MVELKSRSLEKFATTFGLLMTAVGWSVGSGNYWRFSWRAANYGGGSFLFTYLVWLIVFAFAAAVAEYAIGKYGEGGVLIGPYNFAKRHKKLASFGGVWMAWSTALIYAYYGVVVGWIFIYMLLSWTGYFWRPDFDALALWNSIYNQTPALVALILMFVMGLVVLSKGVRGVETVAKAMFPLLYIFTIILGIYALTVPGAREGLEFYYTPRVEALKDPSTWMQSLSQVIWSAGIAWGFFITAGAYMRKRDDVTLAAFGNITNDSAVGWTAGLAIIPIIFALSATPFEDIKAAGTGLAFVSLPRLLSTAPKSWGWPFAVLFFTAFWFAAFTSYITIWDVGSKIYKDLGVPKAKAALIFGLIWTIVGLPTTMPGTRDWLDYYDTVWGIAGLTVGLVFIALIVAYWHNAREVREKINSVEPKPLIRLGSWWDIELKLLPIIAAVFFFWWIGYKEWMQGWGAGLHAYYTFPGFLMLIIGGAIIYWSVNRVLNYMTGGGE